MAGYNNIQAYKNAFANVDKVNQVIMLFDAAVTSLQQAKQAIVDKKIEERFNKISKAFQIITGLRDSLDHTNGGEVAAVLADWYSGTALRIITINRTLDLNLCDMCIDHIKQMRDAWVEVEKQVKGGDSVNSSENQANTTSTTSGNTTGGIEAIANNNDFFTAAIRKAAYGSSSGSGTVINV